MFVIETRLSNQKNCRDAETPRNDKIQLEVITTKFKRKTNWRNFHWQLARTVKKKKKELYRFWIVSFSNDEVAHLRWSRGLEGNDLEEVSSAGFVWSRYRENGNCRGGSLSASSRPRLNCDVVVWFYGLFFINSIVRYQPECRRYGICPVAELEIRLESLHCPTNLTAYRLREGTRVRSPVLAKSPDALESRN